MGPRGGRPDAEGTVQTFEAATHLDAFFALGVIDETEYDAAEERLSRIGMMLRRLMQKERRRKRALRRERSERRESAL